MTPTLTDEQINGALELARKLLLEEPALIQPERGLMNVVRALLAMKAERDKWKCEYVNLCDFANAFQDQRDELRALLAEKDTYLGSIFRNGCCSTCQEAKLVAIKALTLTGPQALAKMQAMEEIINAARKCVFDAKNGRHGFYDLNLCLEIYDNATKTEEVGK